MTENEFSGACTERHVFHPICLEMFHKLNTRATPEISMNFLLRSSQKRMKRKFASTSPGNARPGKVKNHICSGLMNGARHAAKSKKALKRLIMSSDDRR